jgi:membrane protein DedA with SNARE-associated domain
MLNVGSSAILGSSLLAQSSYLGVFVLIFLESMALPIPGEITLISAEIYASQNHAASPIVIVVAAILGAFLGSLAGYMIGYFGGFKLVVNKGRRIGLTYERIKVGHYAFAKFGIWIVLFGRFATVFRSLLGLLSGITRMPRVKFLVANLGGAIAWSSAYGFGSYSLGNTIKRYSTIFTYVAVPVAIIVIVIGFILLKKNEKRLIRKAEEMYPGPIEHLQ